MMGTLISFTDFIKTQNYIKKKKNSRTLDDNIFSQKGNSPDYLLRSLIYLKVLRNTNITLIKR